MLGKKYKKRFFASLLGISTTLLVFILVNIFCYFDGGSERFYSLRTNNESIRQEFQNTIVDFKSLDLKPVLKKKKQYPFFNRNLHKLDFKNAYTYIDNYVPDPNHIYRSTVVNSTTGDAMYDVSIQLRNYRQRYTPSPANRNSNTAIILFGCSVTFGVGVENDETFAAILNAQLPDSFRVYNFGITGAGLNDAFHDIKLHPERFFQIPEKNIILITTFIDHHLFRQSCTTECLTGDPVWLDRPKYAFDEKTNRLIYVGKLGISFKPAWWKSLILKMPVISYFNLYYPNIYNEENLDLYVQYQKEFRLEYEKQFNVIASYHLNSKYVTPHAVNLLTPKLQKESIRVITMNSGEFETTYPDISEIPGDGHPTPAFHQLMAETILFRLKNDHLVAN